MADGKATIAGGVPVPRRNPRNRPAATSAQKRAGKEVLKRKFAERAHTRIANQHKRRLEGVIARAYQRGAYTERERQEQLQIIQTPEGRTQYQQMLDGIRKSTGRTISGGHVGTASRRHPHGKGI